MIKHIAMYQLRDKNKISDLIAELKKMDACKLIVDNQAYATLNSELPILPNPMFADVIHICYFANMQNANMYPTSLEHQNLVKNTNDYILHTMTIDFNE